MKTQSLAFLFVVINFYSCEKPQEKTQLPSIETSSAVVDNKRVECISKVLDEGTSSLTDQGICWSISPQPTLEDHVMVNEVNSESPATGFINKIPVHDLKPNTTYYIKAFATNIQGTGFGNQLTFKTDSCDTTPNRIEFSNSSLDFPNVSLSQDSSGQYVFEGSSVDDIFTLTMRFAEIPETGIYTTVNAWEDDTLGPAECSLECFPGGGEILFNEGNTIEVIKEGNSYSASFCRAQAYSLFFADGNLTLE
jgi:hypothetical protein